jgi:hypothetical protein
MYEMSQRHPVWVTENHVKPCNSVGGVYWIPASTHKVARLYHSVKVCKFFAHC